MATRHTPEEYLTLVAVATAVGFMIGLIVPALGFADPVVGAVSLAVGFAYGFTWARNKAKSLSKERDARLRPDGRCNTR